MDDLSEGGGNVQDIEVNGERIALITRPRATPKKAVLYRVALIAYLAPLVMGYTIGYSSPAIPMLNKEFNLSDTQDSWFASLMAIGAIFGGPFAGFLLSRIGRKGTVMASAVPFAVGYLFIGVVPSVWAIYGLYLGRILTGFGAGMASLSTPVYLSELADPDSRGFLGTGFQVSVTVGISLVYILGIPFTNTWLSISAIVLCAFLVLLMLPSPDTPRYWLMRHQRARSLKVLETLRGAEVDVDMECREIENTLDNSDDRLSMSEFFSRPVFLPLCISLALMFFQQFSGINTVMFYSVSIFQSAAPDMDPHLATIIVGLTQVIATCVAAVLMDRLGRKVLLVIAGVMMACSSFTFGLYYQLTDNGGNSSNSSLDLMVMETGASTSHLSWLSIISMVIYIIGFSLGLGPIPWLLMSEIFPSKARGIGTGIATATNWLFAFIVTKEFTDLEKAITTQGAFWFFAGVMVLEVIFVIFVLPETKGKSLEEIERIFKKRS